MSRALFLACLLSCTSSSSDPTMSQADAPLTTPMRQKLDCVAGHATLMMSIDRNNPPTFDALLCNPNATTGVLCGIITTNVSMYADRIDINCTASSSGYDTVYLTLR